MTENAFLEGYKAALMEHNRDSVWNDIKEKYKFD
jgi:hypothetical protein